MSITSLNGYSRRMDKLEQSHTPGWHQIMIKGSMHNMDEPALIENYCADHPEARPTDNFMFVQWINTVGPKPAPANATLQ